MDPNPGKRTKVRPDETGNITKGEFTRKTCRQLQALKPES